MKFICICFLLLKASQAFEGAEDLEDNDSGLSARIQGGATDSSGRFQSIVKLAAIFRERRVLCTGVLINPTNVLTSAGCVRRFAETAQQVEGTVLYTKRSKICTHKFISNRIIVHENFISTAADTDGGYKDNDIAIVKIDPKEKPVGAVPARLPKEKRNGNKPVDYWNKGLTLAGWKGLEDGEINVQIAAVTVYARCIDNEPSITERQICTANDNTVMLCQNHDKRSYDIGAPLFDRPKGKSGTLIGIGSGYSPLCDMDPSIFTFVPKFLPWIKEVLRRKYTS